MNLRSDQVAALEQWARGAALLDDAIGREKAALARAEQAEQERDEYRDENARLRQALSQYQQPGALVRYGVQHEPKPWLLLPMEDGYWTPWHVANADAIRLTAECDAARTRAEAAETCLADRTKEIALIYEASQSEKAHLTQAKDAALADLAQARQARDEAEATIASLRAEVDAVKHDREIAYQAAEFQRLTLGAAYEDKCKAEQQRDAALAERDALFNSAWALLNDEPQANGEYVHAVTCSADRKKPIGCGGCSCQLGRRIKLLASALTEARRVLREVLSELRQASDWGVVSDLQAEIRRRVGAILRRRHNPQR